MYEIMPLCGVDLVIRKGTVDRDNVDWMEQARFLTALREMDIAPEATVFDLGAHIGSFAIVAAKLKGCRVIGFEPDAASRDLAKANALINGVADRVAIHGAAVGGRDDKVLLFEATENWGHTIIADGSPANELTGRVTEVTMLPLAAALDLSPDRRCAFMKFNIEGAEHEMFEAASKETLARIGALVGEVHYDLGCDNFEPQVTKLRNCGFKVDLVPTGEVRAILIARRP